MTASTLADIPHQHQRAAAPPAPTLFRTWTSSFLIYFYPGKIRNLWTRASLPQSIAIALLNLFLAPLWLALVGTAAYCWDALALRANNYLLADYVPHPAQKFLELFTAVPQSVHAFLHDLPWFADVSFAFTLLLCTLTGLGILFFVLLPFAARPGKNRACVRHVIRAVLLSTGWVHLWFPLLTALFLYFIAYRYAPGLENIIGPLTLAILALSLWTLISLVIAVRADYRSPADLPQPHDPWCELCGYNLTGINPETRCPECGKSIAESLSPHTRPPTPWESRPSLFNLSAVRGQLSQIIRQPRQLFFSMPTLTGQRPAQRWLIASVSLVGLLATAILPAYNLLCNPPADRMDWAWPLLVGSLFVGFVWAILALMMVGIETAGIATFSRIRAKREPDFGGPGSREGVFLGTSAKVTAYSSILMVPWVFLGGAQLIASQYWNLHHFTMHLHVSWRVEQILLAASLSIAHIGGLLWYEITVYRGIRGIQYANK
ncbi:MAG: hypothetical protein ACTHN5_09830 [Phycisphaerae bacterium]